MTEFVGPATVAEYFEGAVRPNYIEFCNEPTPYHRVQNICVSLLAIADHWRHRKGADPFQNGRPPSWEVVRAAANPQKHAKFDKFTKRTKLFVLGDTSAPSDLAASATNTVRQSGVWKVEIYGEWFSLTEAIHNTFDWWEKRLVESD